MDYELIFRRGKHNIVERFRDNAYYPIQKAFLGNHQLNKIVENQKTNTDLFINKYPSSGIVSHIILDVDSKKLKDARADAESIKQFMESKGHNTVLVFSTRKGFHVYIAIHPYKFTNNNFFKEFVEAFINRYEADGSVNYPNLDPANTNAGLKGNIRVINSIHPVTRKRVEIIDGTFIGNQENTAWQKQALKIASERIIKQDVEARDKQLKTLSFNFNSHNNDYQTLIDENDLREIIPAVYGVDLKHYDGYSMGVCPMHNDKKPSLMVTKEWFKCLACEWQGNINNIIADGDLDKDSLR